MISEKGTSLGDNSSATDMLKTDDVAVYLRHNQKYARDLRQTLAFAKHVDNNS